MTSANGVPWLSLITFFPLLGALILLLLPRRGRTPWYWALLVTTVTFLLSLPLFFGWEIGEAGYQFVERRPWAPELGLNYIVGVDGISLFLVLLTTFLGPIVILSSWNSIADRPVTYLFLMLVLETGMLGVFVALDLVLFFLFWEATLIPMYFIIGVWGGPRRVYAAVKFFLYTMAGSALMLVAILALRHYSGTFDLVEILAGTSLDPGVQRWLFLAFALAFAIKVPLFPFHTWLPDAHVEAPTAGSVILAGILLKMGTYGYVRFALPLFPEAAASLAELFIVLAVIGILYGGMVALRQRDFKSLVAYSSVAHLGFVMLGIFAMTPQGLSGAVLQMINHGLSTGALFLLVGMIYERRHTRLLSDFGGVWAVMPVYGAFLLVTILSSVGLPGLNGFVGEFSILIGAFQTHRWAAILAALGVIVAAWYLLHAFREVMQGPLDKPENKRLTDLTKREVLILVPVTVMFFLIGLFPSLFFDRINPTVMELQQYVAQHQGMVVASLLR
ncbi:MAG TPA: NADH-quinone oxidoreductase subunit M [Caldilineae bacterium]|nr:NADH-quinone oxidoreductase subunit M [Caldilineae bacterium]